MTGQGNRLRNLSEGKCENFLVLMLKLGDEPFPLWDSVGSYIHASQKRIILTLFLCVLDSRNLKQNTLDHHNVGCNGCVVKISINS
jgi:hypothetical protein